MKITLLSSTSKYLNFKTEIINSHKTINNNTTNILHRVDHQNYTKSGLHKIHAKYSFLTEEPYKI